MKPTDKVVKLACQLYDAGYPQEIQEGDWVKCDVYKGIHLVCSAYREWVVLNELGHVFEKDCIPIPDLSTCLRWLEEYLVQLRVKVIAKEFLADELGWKCRWFKDRWWNIEADTPEEACMLAMLKILGGE